MTDITSQIIGIIGAFVGGGGVVTVVNYLITKKNKNYSMFQDDFETVLNNYKLQILSLENKIVLLNEKNEKLEASNLKIREDYLDIKNENKFLKEDIIRQKKQVEIIQEQINRLKIIDKK